MKKIRRPAQSEMPTRPSKEAVDAAYMAYDLAAKGSASTARVMELHRNWKVLHAERYGT